MSNTDPIHLSLVPAAHIASVLQFSLTTSCEPLHIQVFIVTQTFSSQLHAMVSHGHLTENVALSHTVWSQWLSRTVSKSFMTPFALYVHGKPAPVDVAVISVAGCCCMFPWTTTAVASIFGSLGNTQGTICEQGTPFGAILSPGSLIQNQYFHKTLFALLWQMWVRAENSLDALLT